MAKSTFRHVRITGITAVVPEKCINIDDEIEFFNNDPKLLERNKKILGLGTRHVIDGRTCFSDLCEAAANRLFEKLAVDRATVDTLLVSSTSHDYRYPATACVLQNRLGLPETVMCNDLCGLGCSAYVHALLQAFALIESGASKRCLICAGDLKSLHSDRRNRNSNMLFGDAATATLVEYSGEETPSYFVTGSRGAGWDKLIAPAGGHDIPIYADIAGLEVVDASGNVWRMWDDIMKGMEIFKFSTEVGPKSVSEALELAGCRLEDVDYFAFHQANKQIVRSVGMYLGLPADKFSTEAFRNYGNCGVAAVVTDVCHNLHGKKLQKVCVTGFGVGLSWASVLLDLGQTFIGPVEEYKTPDGKMTREEKIRYWISYFKGE